MNKQEIIKQYSKEEDRFLIAKILDKMQFTSTRNQVQTTDFLDGYQQKIAQKVLQQSYFKNAILYGGFEESERKVLFLFPEKLVSFLEMPVERNTVIQNIIKVISITLPNDIKGKYHHRDYLSGIMKLGIKREKIGDIIVTEDGANILTQNDMAPYLLSNLPELTRFQKAKIEQKDISELKQVSILKEDIVILVTQLRLDIVISELLHISRTKANEIIAQERVFINYEVKTKNSTLLKQGDLLTIRGKGKFQIGETIMQTPKGKLRIAVEKYVS